MVPEVISYQVSGAVYPAQDAPGAASPRDASSLRFDASVDTKLVPSQGDGAQDVLRSTEPAEESGQGDYMGSARRAGPAKRLPVPTELTPCVTTEALPVDRQSEESQRQLMRLLAGSESPPQCSVPPEGEQQTEYYSPLVVEYVARTHSQLAGDVATAMRAEASHARSLSHRSGSDRVLGSQRRSSSEAAIEEEAEIDTQESRMLIRTDDDLNSSTAEGMRQADEPLSTLKYAMEQVKALKKERADKVKHRNAPKASLGGKGSNPRHKDLFLSAEKAPGASHQNTVDSRDLQAVGQTVPMPQVPPKATQIAIQIRSIPASSKNSQSNSPIRQPNIKVFQA